MRIEKAVSSLGSTSTIMCLLIFSLLISGPGAAYPVEGGMHIRSITQYVRVLTVSVYVRVRHNLIDTALSTVAF